MHKKLHDSILLLSRRCKYIIKPTNTLSKSSSTNVVTIRPLDRTVYAKSLSDCSTVSSHIVDVNNRLLSGANLFEPPICGMG